MINNITETIYKQRIKILSHSVALVETSLVLVIGIGEKGTIFLIYDFKHVSCFSVFILSLGNRLDALKTSYQFVFLALL